MKILFCLLSTLFSSVQQTFSISTNHILQNKILKREPYILRKSETTMPNGIFRHNIYIKVDFKWTQCIFSNWAHVFDRKKYIDYRAHCGTKFSALKGYESAAFTNVWNLHKVIELNRLRSKLRNLPTIGTYKKNTHYSLSAINVFNN